jgi:pyruvate/oxaloacetate carboxyltransferase
MESWGGASCDACIGYLGEEPWDRIRENKEDYFNFKWLRIKLPGYVV